MPAPPDIPLPDGCALAGGAAGPEALRPLLDIVLTALADGAADREGPLPPGGPAPVARRLRSAVPPGLPAAGTGAGEALRTLVRALAAGAADPADPQCVAHLHCPPLAVAAAADLAVSVLNQSLDSWEQAPAAATLETDTAAGLAALVYPDLPQPDALLTTGGTESNQLALLLARERARAAGARGVQVVRGQAGHHSVQRAAWLLGLPAPITLATPAGVLDPVDVHSALGALRGTPALLAVTAGTTDTGAVDPLPALAEAAAAHGAELHVDAAYGGPLLFSARHRALLDGLQSAASVTVDLHKLGWQPVAAGLLAVPDATALRPLHHRADYLNAADDTEAGLPDLLGRSLRTTRRPDVLKIAVTLRALGRDGLGALVDRVCDQARRLADRVDRHPGLTLHAPPAISTVLFRPHDADDARVAAIRRALLTAGTAVLGRSHADGRLWLKATLLNPHTPDAALDALLDHVTRAARATPEGPDR
ncbi:aminotransferase class V-fold PLP-dependent enzyme [Streptomyces sp. SL13]|uniref:Aminotransferase class V-fold PLP-dependent enzyme n=1 Tax=Streptantibioticus silvisoli TaxID=2705255 RepID=A0AA90H2V5_9ACTN|nr:aminotransferase class V-fold PLP-dependent enzyme [Streptantibioticus silvisoli]MDI5963181.1 aminotransferase class V-fold PLP-dependent enzyme [Streptantibioticus silvisoli]MDI5970306.1 aminotransferase class V-fold PLP-dependent enzyme [Streptantibioticus silvisoli]